MQILMIIGLGFAAYYSVGLLWGLWLSYRMGFGGNSPVERLHTIFVVGGLAWLFVAAIWVWVQIEGLDDTIYVAARGSESQPNHKVRGH